MRKMHFSSFLVHWLGPGGKTLRVGCRAFFSIKAVLNALAFFFFFFPPPTQKDTQMLCTGVAPVKNGAVTLFCKKIFTLEDLATGSCKSLPETKVATWR